MPMQIRFKHDYRQYKARETHTLSMGIADILVRRGLAERVLPEAAARPQILKNKRK